jgi:multisubunit Na+/H+ antiporter MnhB subunit
VTTILTQTVARILAAPTFAVAAAMLVKGYADVGDGFAAGVVAALGVLFVFAAFGAREAHRVLPVRRAFTVAMAGLLLALAVGFAPLVAGEPPFTHYPPPEAPVVHVGTLELITAVAFDLGVFALVLGVVVGALDYAARARKGTW